MKKQSLVQILETLSATEICTRFCSDSHPSIIAWAKEKHIEHHTFIANKQKIKNKVYHVQHVNSLDSLLER